MSLNRHALKLLQPTATSSPVASLTKFHMDNVMPVLSGADATKRLRTARGFEDVPIVPVSAGVSYSEQKVSLAAGANGRVTKPIIAETLMTSAFKVVPQQGTKVAKKASKAVGVDLLASQYSSR